MRVCGGCHMAMVVVWMAVLVWTVVIITVISRVVFSVVRGVMVVSVV